MEHESVVLIYSKYSESCNELMGYIRDMEPLHFRLLIMRYLCVDSESVREKMRKNQNFSIESVPTLLVNYSNDVMEKYEGQDVYTWIEQFVNIVTDALKPDTTALDEMRYRYNELENEIDNRDKYYESIINQLQQQLITLESQQPKVVVNKQSDDVMPQQHMSSHQSERINQRANDTRHNAPSFDNTLTIHEVDDISSSKDKSDKGTTSIDSLSGEELFADDRPPVPQLNGELSNSFKEFPTPERGTVTSAADKKSASLMAEALKMQKSREDDEPKRPPGAPSVTSD